MDALREQQRVYDLEWEAGVLEMWGIWKMDGKQPSLKKQRLKPQRSRADAASAVMCVMLPPWAVEDSAEAAEEEMDDGLKDLGSFREVATVHLS